MAQVQIHDKVFETFITKAQIEARVSELARQLNKDYKDLNPLFIGILNGSFIFAADLFRHLTIEAEISFIKLASYKGTFSTGNVVTAIGMEENLHERHVVIVEDIIDTGKTLDAFLPEIKYRHVASVKIAALLSKPDAREYDIHPDYLGFEIPNKFIVGYGLDYDKAGRNLPELYILKESV